jgi:hypothetical protein
LDGLEEILRAMDCSNGNFEVDYGKVGMVKLFGPRRAVFAARAALGMKAAFGYV